MAAPFPLTCYRFDVDGGNRSYYLMCDDEGSDYLGNTEMIEGFQAFLCAHLPFFKPQAHERVHQALRYLRWEPMQGEPLRAVRENEMLEAVIAQDNEALVNGRWWVSTDEPANGEVWGAIAEEQKAYARVWWFKAITLILLFCAVVYGFYSR
jgi:hypothetical protein